MKAAVSLWSADLLEVGAALDRLTGVADAFHVDVMDGHFAPDLLFGLGCVGGARAPSRRGAAPVPLTGVADAFHVDVMDGHFAPDLLFGPDFVRAVRKRTRGV